MRILSYTYALMVLLAALSCKDDENVPTKKNADGVLVAIPYQWRTSLHNDKPPISNGYIQYPIYYKNNIIVPTTNGEDSRYLSMLDTDTGKIVWQWNDAKELSFSNQIDILHHYQHKNLLTYQAGSRGYCIDLDNGTSRWKRKGASWAFSEKVSGMGNTVFNFAESESKYHEYRERVVYKSDLLTGAIEEFIVPNFSLEFIANNKKIGSVTRVLPYVLDGVQHLAIPWTEVRDTNAYLYQTFLGLYNYKTNSWVYEKMAMNAPNHKGGASVPPVIYNDKIYTDIAEYLVCHDIKTGEKVWEKKIEGGLFSAGFIIEDGMLIAKSGGDSHTYRINPDNGSTLWKTKTGGASSPLSYLNGVVYFLGGERLHAIDAETGEYVWKLDATQLMDNNDASSRFFPSAAYVIPANGGKPARVIALSGEYAYCFDAYR